MPTPDPTWIAIRSDQLRAEIDPLGAQLSTLQDGSGRDLLWNGDPAVWSGRAPILFPIVGELAGGAYRAGESIHRMPRHGFARRSAFELVDAGAAGATLRLRPNELARDQYPFAFELDMIFEVLAASLAVTACIRNTGTADLPASFGYHPAFRWPLPYGASRESHEIEFPEDEPAMVRRLDAAGLVARTLEATPIAGRRLPLDDELFRRDALIFDAIRSRHVTYGAADRPRIRVEYPDCPYLALWSKPGAGFVCIEPWHGIADPQGYDGDFRDKPGIFRVAPGAERRIRMIITLLTG